MSTRSPSSGTSPISMSRAALRTMRAWMTTGRRRRSPSSRTAPANTGAERSPRPGTSPMRASRPKRILVPGILNWLSRRTAQRRSASSRRTRGSVCTLASAGLLHRPHAVVRLPHLSGHALHQRHDLRRQRLLQGGLEYGLCDILTALRFSDDRVLVLAGHHRLDVDPAAMERRGDAAALLGFPTETTHLILELARHLGALTGIFLEHGLHLGAG